MNTAAFFDLDGTLLKSNIVEYYLYLASQGLSGVQRWGLTLQLWLKAPYYIMLDRWDRDRFNRTFYRNYRSMEFANCQKWSQTQFVNKIRPALFPTALECITKHQAAGRQIIFVTGSLDFIVAPITEFIGADAMLTASLQIDQGKFTGEMLSPPVAGEEKARMMQSLALARGIDLTASYAYADSFADLPMLQAVGHPVAVNPDARLQKIAQKSGWAIADWKLDPINISSQEAKLQC
ncbi:HAD family hydrolase [Microcoleus sp. D2_18a_D3]|uniref:HAD family hydrolase n=1 Tax=Microcoleus sp. D2_18a_D3 TaxID=3055330 RepID=UPI002FD4B1A3